MFLPGKSHGQRILEGYSPRGGKEWDTTGRLNNNNIATERGLRYPTSPKGSILGYSSASSHQVSDIGLTHTAPGSLLCGRARVCVSWGWALFPRPHMSSVGSPEVVPMPPASGHGLLTPQLMPQGLPTPCSVLPVRVGRSRVCVCVCVCVWGYGHPSARGVPQLDSNQPSSGWGWGLQSCIPLSLGAHRKSSCCPTNLFHKGAGRRGIRPQVRSRR